MDNRDLWLVNIEQGLGPLVLGALRPRVLDALEASEVQASFDPYGRESPIRIAQLGIWLVFADDDSQTLRRIDVTNPRVHFATWDVIGKPIHKAVRLFKCAENETLWCKSFEESEQRALSSVDRAKLKVPGDVELLRRGTLWIPALGLGFSLKDGKIDKLHLCKPEHVPKLGTGKWNVAQKTMSEQGRIPHREIRIGVEESRATKSVRTILKVMLVAA